MSSGEAFEYDSAGHRTAKTSGGNRTLYIWSGDQMMGETNTIGNSLSQVVRVGSLLLGEVRGGVAQHFDQDAFNSVIVTTLADGTIPGRLSYRAFGAIRTTTGLINSPFRFNGYIDDGNGELSSPARYYASALGRFTGMDPAAMDPMNPITGNPYLGLNGNPMANIDPTGRYAEAGHYYTTYIVALATGYTHEESLQLALYSQLPDEIGKFDAIHAPIREGLMASSNYSATAGAIVNSMATPETHYTTDIVQPLNHALTGGFSFIETQDTAATVIAAQSLEVAGLAIHRLGDTFAHRQIGHEAFTYKFPIGHTLDGTDPDQATLRPKLYGDYVETLARTLAARKGIPLSNEYIAQIRESLESVAARSDVAVASANRKFENASIGDGVGNYVLAYNATRQEGINKVENAENDFRASLRAMALGEQNKLHVVKENSNAPGSVLLQPDEAEAPYLNAAGQEDQDIKNFLDIAGKKANVELTTPLYQAKLRATLEISEAQFERLYKKCSSGSCK